MIANKLLNKLNGMNKEDSLPSWLSDKITIAQNQFIKKSSDYYELIQLNQ